MSDFSLEEWTSGGPSPLGKTSTMEFKGSGDTFSLDDWTGAPAQAMAPPPPEEKGLAERFHSLSEFSIGDNTFNPIDTIGGILSAPKSLIDATTRKAMEFAGMPQEEDTTIGQMMKAIVQPKGDAAPSILADAAANVINPLAPLVKAANNPYLTGASEKATERATDLAFDPTGLAFAAQGLPKAAHTAMAGTLAHGITSQGLSFVDEVKKNGFSPAALEHLVSLSADGALLALGSLGPKERAAVEKSPKVQEVLREKGISLDPSDPSAPSIMPEAPPAPPMTKKEKKAAKAAEAIRMKPLPPEDVPSVPMVPELGPGETALPEVWTGQPYRGDPAPQMVQTPGEASTTALGEVPFFGAPEGVTMRAGEAPPVAEAAPILDRDTIKLIEKINKEQEKGPNAERFSEARETVKEIEAVPPSEEGQMKPPPEMIPEDELSPLPIELRATIQEVIGEGFKPNKTSIKEISEKLGVPEGEAKELFWKTKRALKEEKEGGSLPLEDLEEGSPPKDWEAERLADLKKDAEALKKQRDYEAEVQKDPGRVRRAERKRIEKVLRDLEIKEAERGIFEEGQPITDRWKTTYGRDSENVFKVTSDKISSMEAGNRKALTQNETSLDLAPEAHQWLSPQTKKAAAENPQLQKLKRWVENIFPSAKESASRVLPGREADISQSRLDSLEYDPKKLGARRSGEFVKDGKIEFRVGERGKISFNPWQIAREIQAGVKEGRIRPEDASRAFGQKLIDTISHENAHVGEGGRLGAHGKSKNTGRYKEQDSEGFYDLVSANKEFAFKTAHESVMNDPARRAQMEGILSDVNAPALKEMYESIAGDSNVMFREMSEGRKKMVPPPGEGRYSKTMNEDAPSSKTDRVMGKEEYYDDVMAPSPKEVDVDKRMKKAAFGTLVDEMKGKSKPLTMNEESGIPSDESPYTPKVKKSSDFFNTGVWEVTVNGETHGIYRDPESGLWQMTPETDLPRKNAQTGGAAGRDYIGSNKKEALTNIILKSIEKSKSGKGLKPPPPLLSLGEAKPIKGHGRESERGAIQIGGKGINPNAPIPPLNVGPTTPTTVNPKPTSPKGKAQQAAVPTSLMGKAINEVKDIASGIRVITVGGDISSPFRQSWIQTLAHPVQSVKNMKVMAKALKESSYDQLVKDTEAHVHYDAAKKAGLHFGEDEQYQGIRYLEKRLGKTPTAFLSMTERGYNAYLKATRMDSFARGMDTLEGKFGKGKVTPEAQAALAKWINTSTGRGTFNAKHWEKAASDLNKVFFSPRLLKSRLDVFDARVWNPESYWRKLYKDSPDVAKMAAGDIARSVGTMGSLVALAAAGGAEVEGDPRSSDFGMIRVGNTRIDPWGGYQQYVRYAAQLLSGQRKTQYNELKDVKVGDIIQQFTRSKLAPIPGFAWTAKEGKNFIGRRAPLDDPSTYWETFGPMALRDMVEVYKEDPVLGVAAIMPIALGFGVTTREPLKASKEVRDEYSRLKIRPPTDVQTLPDLSTPGEKDPLTGKLKRKSQELPHAAFKEAKEKGDQMAFSEVEKLIQSPSYKKLSDGEKRIALNRLSRRLGGAKRKLAQRLQMKPPPSASVAP